MRSSNPVFRHIERSETYSDAYGATYKGIITKSAMMFLLAVVTGFFARYLLMDNIEALVVILPVSAVVGFIAVIVGVLSVRLAAPFALLYAACEGIMLGTLTVLLETAIPGVALSAVGATALLFGVMLLLYTSRTIRVTDRFRKIMFASLITILLFVIIGSIFGSVIFPNGMPSGLAIIVSLILIIYGAFMLTMDFDRAETIVSMGADKRHEWQVALGLMITVVWIYVEMLRLFAIIYSKRD